jgi:hypothetical protein
MTDRACRHAMVLGVVLASLGAGVETAAASDRVTVRVWLENAADVPRRILDGAQFDASRIYRDAGIDIIWLNRDDREGRDAGRIIHVVLPSLEGADQYLSREHVAKSVLAKANAAAGLIHIFWERLHISASHQGRDEAGLLAVVLAHEIGHVLLPGAGHSSTGIMQARVEVRMLAPLRFTDQQSEAMRELLRQAPDLTGAGTQAIAIR